MDQHLIRHFQSLPQSSGPHTDLWIRVTCTLTLLIPLITSLTVGRKTKATSDHYFLQMTPPDCFFRVWIIIYLLCCFMMIYAAIADCWSINIWVLFSTINASCGVWAFTFNSGFLWAVNVSIFCQFINLIANEFIWIFLADARHTSLTGTTMGILIRNLVAFINGWFIAAAALGLFIILVYTFGLSSKLQLPLFWIAAPIVYLAFILYNILVVGTFKETIGIFFTMGWAVYGAFLSSTKNRETLLETRR